MMRVTSRWRSRLRTHVVTVAFARSSDSAAREKLPHSATRSKTAGVGTSYIDDWGYAGFSVSTLKNLYGIPSDEGSKIDQKQTRYDFDSLIKQPFAGFESVRLKAGYTDYKHAELGDDNAPVTRFPGYWHWRRTKSVVEARGPQIAEDAVRRRLPEMGG